MYFSNHWSIINQKSSQNKGDSVWIVSLRRRCVHSRTKEIVQHVRRQFNHIATQNLRMQIRSRSKRQTLPSEK
jgi:hypothetical protein